MSVETFKNKFTCDGCGKTEETMCDVPHYWQIVSLGAYNSTVPDKDRFYAFGENYHICGTCLGDRAYCASDQKSSRLSVFKKLFNFLNGNPERYG